jgi:aspartate/glutamate/aspartate-prephenate aminotransferase
VVVTNGAKQAIAQAVIGLCGPGDDVIVPAPFWVSYPEMVRLSGANPVIIPTTPAQGFLLTAVRFAGALADTPHV